MKNYVVYLNKSNDVWARDGHTWAEKNNIPVDDMDVISEVVFWHYLKDGIIGNNPVYFCGEIQDDRQPFNSIFQPDPDDMYDFVPEDQYYDYSEPKYPQYDEDAPIMEQSDRSDNPEYIVASVCFKEQFKETYVFEANENGEILNFGEYGGIAERFGDEDWSNHKLAVERTFGDKYEFVREIETIPNIVDHFLYKRKD